MRRTTRVALSTLSILILFGAWAPAAWGDEELSEVVIFATNSIELGKNTEVLSGDVVVNDFSDGPTLTAGVELAIDKDSQLGGNVKADSIQLGAGVLVAGAIECNEEGGGDSDSGSDDSDSDSGSSLCTGLLLPVFTEEQLPEARTVVLAPGAADIDVDKDDEVTLDAGDYADIRTDKNGTLVFTGGIYNIGSLIAGKEATLVFQAPAELRILGVFRTDKNAFIGPADDSTPASGILIFVGGTNSVPADPSSTPAAAIGKDAIVEASFFVPNGTLSFGKNVSAAGAFLARDVQADKDGHFTLASFFNPQPVADDQTVFTNGTTPLDVTLTGSDPCDEILTFSIVAGPSQGTLSGLIQDPPASASVTYTASQTGDLADSFTFRVIDPNGGFDEAVVAINPVDDPDEPPAPTDTVIGKDDSLEVVTDTTIDLTLVGFADVADPASVGDFTFRIVSGPTSGTLDPDPPAPSEPTASDLAPPVPADLFDSVRTATTTYTPDPGFEGADSFDFEVCGDLTGDDDTDDAGECDTATIAIEVGAFTPPDPTEPPEIQDQAVTTVEDEPVVIDLSQQPGDGSGEPGDGRIPPSFAIPYKGAPLVPQKTTVTYGDQTAFLAAVTSPATYDFEQPVFPAASAVIGSVDDIFFDGRIGFAVNPPPPSGDQFMRGTDPCCYTGPGFIDFSGLLPNLPDAIGFFTGFGAIANRAPFVRITVTRGNESEEVFFVEQTGGAGAYFGFVNSDLEVLGVAFEGFEADLVTPAVQQFGIDDMTIGEAGQVLPDLVVASLTHDPAIPDESTTIDFQATVENIGDATAGASTLCFEIGGESCSGNPAATQFDVPALAPGETFEVDRTATLIAQSYQNTAIADVEGVVDESDENNNTTIDTYTVVVAEDGLFATITTLPLFGTLVDQTLQAITQTGPIPGVAVVYMPNAGSTTPDFFEFTVTNTATGLTSVLGRVDLVITLSPDDCAAQGRPPGCTPGP